MKFVLSNDTAQIPLLAEQVEAWLTEMEAADIALKINLCLDELLTNTINYGYGDDAGEHEIVIDMTVQDGSLSIEIVDDARPFDPTSEPPEPDLDAPLEERRVGGLGVFLVKNLTDSMHYYADDQGHNHLILTKNLA